MQEIISNKAPGAIGVYSQAVKHQDTVYISGQIPLDPTTMNLCSTDILEQIEQVMKNLTAVCEAAGGTLGDIIKLNIYLIDLKHFNLVNETMLKFFNKPYPARAVIGVASLPKDAQVEIDAIMILTKRSLDSQ